MRKCFFLIFRLPSSREKNYMEFLLPSLKTLTYYKNCSESRIKFLFLLSFALVCKIFPVYIYSRLSEQFSESQAGYEQLLETHAAIRKPEQTLGNQKKIYEIVWLFFD